MRTSRSPTKSNYLHNTPKNPSQPPQIKTGKEECPTTATCAAKAADTQPVAGATTSAAIWASRIPQLSNGLSNREMSGKCQDGGWARQIRPRRRRDRIRPNLVAVDRHHLAQERLAKGEQHQDRTGRVVRRSRGRGGGLRSEAMRDYGWCATGLRAGTFMHGMCNSLGWGVHA